MPLPAAAFSPNPPPARSRFHLLSSKTQEHGVLIDAHVHVFERNPRFPFAPGAHPPAEDAPPEKLIELMRANGVARTVIIQVIHYKWDNSFPSKRPQTLSHTLPRCLPRVNPEDPAAPDTLTQLTEEGFLRRPHSVQRPMPQAIGSSRAFDAAALAPMQ